MGVRSFCCISSVLVLSYDDAHWQSAAPYFRHVLKPAKVLKLMGKNRLKDQPVPGSHCVYYGMRDVVFPFILSRNWWEDTVFFVFEEDWRLTAD